MSRRAKLTSVAGLLAAASIAAALLLALSTNSSSAHPTSHPFFTALLRSDRTRHNPTDAGASGDTGTTGATGTGDTTWSDTPGTSSDQPLPNDTTVASVADASAALHYNVPQADTDVANPGSLTSVQIARSTREAALVYRGGDVSITIAPATYSDPTAEFSQFLGGDNATASIGSIGGLPTLVISPGSDVAHSNPAWVEFDLNGLDVNIFSQKKTPRPCWRSPRVSSRTPAHRARQRPPIT